MAIKRVLDLPTPKTTTSGGWQPDSTPRFGPLLAQQWHDAAVPLPRAHPDARFRHSDAGACARAIAYAALDLPPSNPMDLAGTWVTGLGSMIHQAWQAALTERFPGAEIEVKVHDGERAGHVDAVVTTFEKSIEDEHRRETKVAIEYKSVGGYKYQLAVGARGEPEGPSYSHIVQAALNAKALNADEAVIIYGGRDVISHQMAARKPHLDEHSRFTAEWTLTRQEYEPIADREIDRIERILALVDEGTLPIRRIPDLPKAVIVSPRDGSWAEFDSQGLAVNAGSTWHCLYCRWTATCAKTNATRIPVETLVEIGALDAVREVHDD